MIRRWGIRGRVMVVAFAPALTIATLLGVYFTHIRFADLEASVRDTGLAMVRQLALAAEYGVFSGNREALDDLAAAMVRESGVIGVAIYDRDGQPLAYRGPAMAAVRQLIGARQPIQRDIDDGRALLSSAPIFQRRAVLEEFYDATAPGLLASPDGARLLGQVHVALSKDSFIEKRARLLIEGGIIVLFGLAGGALLALQLSRDVIRPVVRLTGAVEQLARGNLDTRIEPDTGGAVRGLEDGINTMARALKSATADLERRVATATAELAQKRVEAERANEAKTRFLAAASHDLRQPLHAIGLYVATLEDQALPDQARPLVAQLGKSVAMLQDLLEALLDISRLDAGNVKPDLTVFPVNQLLSSIEMRYAPPARAKQLTLRVMSCQAVVRTDPLLLDRILFNLVSNAVRYTLRGKVLIGCRRRGSMLRIEVWDTGIGIPEGQQDCVFEEFRRGPGAAQIAERGLGLGLAIVDRLTHLLHHPLELRSVPGKGSVFTVSVPLARRQDLPAPVGATVVDSGLLPGAEVLLIDDDAEALRSMQALLAQWHCSVSTADGGAAALDGLRQPGRATPRIVISDLRLARESGANVLDLVRARYGDQVIGILVSGDTSSEVRAIAARHGYPLLTKPVRPGKLRALMEQLLRRRQNLVGDD